MMFMYKLYDTRIWRWHTKQRRGSKLIISLGLEVCCHRREDVRSLKIFVASRHTQIFMLKSINYLCIIIHSQRAIKSSTSLLSNNRESVPWESVRWQTTDLHSFDWICYLFISSVITITLSCVVRSLKWEPG